MLHCMAQILKNTLGLQGTDQEMLAQQGPDFFQEHSADVYAIKRNDKKICQGPTDSRLLNTFFALSVSSLKELFPHLQQTDLMTNVHILLFTACMPGISY